MTKKEAIKEIEKMIDLPVDCINDYYIWFGKKRISNWYFTIFKNGRVEYGNMRPEILTDEIIEKIKQLIPILFKEGEQWK